MNKYTLTSDVMEELIQRINKGSKRKNSTNTIDFGINVSKTNGIVDDKYVGYSSHHILVIFTGTDVGLTESLRELSRVKKYGFTFDVAFSYSGAQVIGESGINHIKSVLSPNKVYFEEDQLIFGDIIESVDGILVTMTTQDTAAKLTLGIQDNFISTLLWQAIWHGKIVLMDFDNVIRYRGTESKSPIQQQIINEYVDKLNKMSVISVDKKSYVVEMLKKFKNVSLNNDGEQSQSLQQPVNTNSESERRIITEKDLLEIAGDSKEVTVPLKAIVTPLAIDTAKKQSIKIIKK